MSSTLGPAGYEVGPDPHPYNSTLIAKAAQLATLPYQGPVCQVYTQEQNAGALYPAFWNGTKYVAWAPA